MTTVEYLERVIRKLERENAILTERVSPVHLEPFEYGRHYQNRTTINYIKNLIKEVQDD
ncbi:TPA: hypothetical protein ACGO1T_000895 [Streptococcus suis]